MTEHLFIGGVADGHFFDVPDGCDVWNVEWPPVRRPPKRIKSARKPSPVTLKWDSYRRLRICVATSSIDVFAIVAMSDAALLNALISSYVLATDGH